MNTSKSLMSVAVCLITIGSGYSQGTLKPKPNHSSPVPPKSTERRSSEFAAQLKLTPDQQKKVTAIIKSNYEKLKLLANDKKVSESARKAKIEASRKEVTKQIRAILTPKQQKVFDQMIAEAAKKRAQFGKTSQGPKKPPGN